MCVRARAQKRMAIYADLCAEVCVCTCMRMSAPVLMYVCMCMYARLDVCVYMCIHVHEFVI